MKKLIFVACVNIGDEYKGIVRKVLSEYKALNNSINTTLVSYYGNDISIVQNGVKNIVKIQNKKGNRALEKVVTSLIAEDHFDFAYIRRIPLTPYVLSMLNKMRNHGISKILWEIPTYPYDYEHSSFNAKLRLFIDRICRKSLSKYIDRIVTFAPEDKIFGIQTIRTGNGIDVDLIRPRKIAEHGNEIHLIAAAILKNWHGYDRLIKGLAEYKGNRKVVFHLIGDGSCFDEYKSLAEKLKIGDRVIFYGSKTKAEVEDIYDLCDMAVESLGWHRSQVTMGTSLKTREYVAKGMPILASSPMDIFPEGWEYAFYAPIDDSPIDIESVVEFYDGLYENKDKNELAEEIRKIAYERCDMKKMMQPIIDFYDSKVK